MKKIFISAYACEPYKGSEPGIGWNVVNQLSRYFEVHVLTRANNREVIEAFYQANSQEVKPVFHYYDLPKYLSFWKKNICSFCWPKKSPSFRKNEIGRTKIVKKFKF